MVIRMKSDTRGPEKWRTRTKLALANGQPVDTSPHRVEIKRHSVELLLTGSRGSWRDQLSGRVAIGLPSQSGRDANRKYDQVIGESERCSLAERWPAGREPVILDLGRATASCL